MKQYFVLLFVSVFLTACANNPSPFVDSGALLLVESEPLSQRSQMVIARYTHILYTSKLPDAERAELLFQRGVAYDSIGLSSLAIIDYNEALRIKPSLAPVHNSIGVHHIQQGNYLQAYEAFDASLEINPDYDFAIFNRGVALYYGGRAELSMKDAEAFWSMDKSDPFRLLWLYFPEASLDPIRAIAQLKSRRALLDNDHWATSLVDFYLGEKDEGAVVATLITAVKSQTELNNRLCEAYFYMGKYHAARGNNNIAKNYFKLSLSTNVYEYLEHKYARIELANLRLANQY